MTSNNSFFLADLFACWTCFKGLFNKASKTQDASWMQKSYRGCEGYNLPLLVTWTSPQVLLCMVLPPSSHLTSLKANVCCYSSSSSLLPQKIFLVTGTDIKSPSIIKYALLFLFIHNFCVSVTEPLGLYQHQWRLCH